MAVREALVDLDRTRPGVGDRLTGALREAIAGRRIPPGTRLPSSRDLAVDLGVSRGLVVSAYEQLVAEGRLTSRRGSGTVVAASAEVAAPGHTRPRPPRPGSRRCGRGCRTWACSRGPRGGGRTSGRCPRPWTATWTTPTRPVCRGCARNWRAISAGSAPPGWTRPRSWSPPAPPRR
ncbi:GntR family transcriptional regulator [Catellatospora coxensis]